MPLKSATLPHFWRAKRVWSRGVLPATLCRWAMGCTSRRLVDIGEPWKYLEIKAISVCRWEVWTLNRKNDHFRSPVALGYAKIWHNWIIWSLWVYIYIYISIALSSPDLWHCRIWQEGLRSQASHYDVQISALFTSVYGWHVVNTYNAPSKINSQLEILLLYWI